MFYPFTLALHNLLRWAVIVAGMILLYRLYDGVLNRRVWRDVDATAARWFTLTLDAQVVVGVLLYFLFSPVSRAALRNLGAAMGDDLLRYFAVEHVTVMVLAVVAAYTSGAVVERAKSDRAKFVRGAVGYTLAMLLVVAGMPWWRPLLPGIQ